MVTRPRMLEKQLHSNVESLLVRLHRRYYHTYDSRNSPAGFPDFVVVGADRLLWPELKGDGGRLSPAQKDWHRDLAAAGQDVVVWTPDDWFSGRIAEELQALRRPRVTP